MFQRFLGFAFLLILLCSMTLTGFAAEDATNSVINYQSRTDFEAVCAVFSGTQTSDLGDQGGVVLAADFSDDFPGSSLNSTFWTSGNYSGAATPVVSGGLLTVPGGVFLQSNNTFTRGVIETTAQFGTSVYHHIGFSSDALNNKYIIFSVINDLNLYARVNDGISGEQRVELGPVPSGLHRYTIEWTALDATTDQVTFYIDGTLAAGPITFNAAAFVNSNIYLANVLTGGADLTVDNVQAAPPYATNGTYTSCTLDAGSGSAWQSIAWDALIPTGAGLTVETRTSTDGITWNSWNTASSSAGTTISPVRYLEFRLNLTGDTQVTPLVDSVSLSSMQWEGGAPLDYGQLEGLPASANYVAWLNSSINASGIPDEVITEDSYNATIGADLGYQNQYWLLSTDKFTTPAATNGDTVNLIFGGLLADSGKLWSYNFSWNGGIVEHTPPVSLVAASGADCPVMLPGSFTPGDPAEKVINWSGTAGKYHVYRSITPSGAGNNQSDGRYDYVGSVEGTGPTFTFTDTLPSGVSDSWHIVVPADSSTNAINGCHTGTESSPTAVKLSYFTASNTVNPKTTLAVSLSLVLATLLFYFLNKGFKKVH